MITAADGMGGLLLVAIELPSTVLPKKSIEIPSLLEKENWIRIIIIFFLNVTLIQPIEPRAVPFKFWGKDWKNLRFHNIWIHVTSKSN